MPKTDYRSDRSSVMDGRGPPSDPNPSPLIEAMRILSLALSCLLLSASCGGSSDPSALASSGMEALRSGDHSAAESSFQQALDAIGGDTSHPQYKRSMMGAIEARIHTDAGKAKDDFIALQKALGDKITDKDFQSIANKMGGAGKFKEAIALLTAGKEIFKDSATLDKLGASLAKQAAAAGDSSATDALAGLGYVGD